MDILQTINAILKLITPDPTMRGIRLKRRELRLEEKKVRKAKRALRKLKNKIPSYKYEEIKTEINKRQVDLILNKYLK